MTDTNMPELTLTPDTAAAAEMPTLTLTPEAPATPAAPEVKKEVEPVVLDDSMLTEQEKAAVNEFAKKIDVRDTNQVLQYGAAAQKSVASFSENALSNVRNKDMGEIGEDLSRLVVELKGFGEDEEKKPSRSSSVIKKILIVLAIFFALSVVFAIVSGMLNKRGSSTADATVEQTESASSSTVDLSDIPGQYWSNAKKILKSRGADLSNAVVLTDDGSTPVVDANWVVTSAYYNDNGNLEIQLTHKNSSGNSSDGQSGTDSSSSNTLEDLSNKVQELGDKAQELGDTAQNLGDTAQNLGGLATDAWNALQNGISGAQGN